MDFRNVPPGSHQFLAIVGHERRPFRLQVPRDLNTRLEPVIAFDGVTLLNPEGSMGGINGLDEASEKYRFAAIYPVPKTRFGIVAGWNAPGGYLRYRPAYNDVEYIRAIFSQLGVDKAYAIGFSAGAQFAHILAGQLPGVIAGVGAICGTWLGTEPSPHPGTALLVVHGDKDPVQPYGGGASSLSVKVLARFGNRNALSSRPNLQAPAYAMANGYAFDPIVKETSVYIERIYGPGSVAVVEYIIRSPYGGHTYHGRRTGPGTESPLSRWYGRPLPAAVFSVNDVFAKVMGLARTPETH